MRRNRAIRPLNSVYSAYLDGPVELYLIKISPWIGYQICMTDGQVVKELGVSISVEPKELGPDEPARPWLGRRY